jgi:molybdate transport system regulatory protein
MKHAGLSIRITLQGKAWLGSDKVAILEAIRETGSISGAARVAKIPYRRTWILIDEINRALREPAVLTQTGGLKGGGAGLTATGEKIIKLFRAIQANATCTTDKDFRALQNLVARRSESR